MYTACVLVSGFLRKSKGSESFQRKSGEEGYVGDWGLHYREILPVRLKPELRMAGGFMGKGKMP